MENTEDTADTEEFEASDQDSSESWIDSVDTHWLSPLELLCHSPANPIFPHKEASGTLTSTQPETQKLVDSDFIDTRASFLSQLGVPEDVSRLHGDAGNSKSTWAEILETGFSNSVAPSSVLPQSDQRATLLENIQEDYLSCFPMSSIADGVVGKVSITMEQCDRSTLDYLLNMTSPLKGRVRLEINP
jgi:hypothetical protein